MATPHTAQTYAIILWQLLPPGRLWRRIADALFYDILLANADELTRLDQRALDLIEEADPRTAVELLPEYERELDLESTGSTAERQARITAWTIRQAGYKPQDFYDALAPLLGTPITDFLIIERSPQQASSAFGDQREIFRFFIYRDPTQPGTYQIDDAQDLVDSMKPSHTAGYVIESVNFLIEDPFSLTDRDVLGL